MFKNTQFKCFDEWLVNFVNGRNKWYSSWFDSKYYHILYSSRDYQEAERFIFRLFEYLNVRKGEKVMDLACGKGRHSKVMAKLGANVFGLDLSKESIDFAKNYEQKNLKFDVHDMREIYKEDSFDKVLNLFTSIGYFDNTDDNKLVIEAVYENLNKGGIFVIDFFNTKKVIENFVPSEEKVVEDIKFDIQRSLENGFILKQIDFSDNGIEYSFTEKVQALNYNDFQKLLKGKFKITKTFGDYELNSFDELISNRLILVCEKIS